MMRPYKGLERLLRVWKKLKPEAATLRFAGPCLDGKYEATLRTLVKETPAVTFTCGFAGPEQVSRHFASADAVILPFESVQTSGSVILALSFGKPVIAPRLGEIPETLNGATDLLYEPGKDESLEQAVHRALEGDLPELGTRSFESCERLSWEQSATRTLACYLAVVRQAVAND